VSCGLNSDNDSQGNYSMDEKASINRTINLMGKLVHGTEERNYILEAQIILRHKIKEHFLVEKPKHTKRPTSQEIF
jgi:hypothetical protein